MFGKITFNPLIKYNPAVIYAIRKPYTNYQGLIKNFDHYMAISTFLKERLIMAGVPEKKIDVVYNIVELDNFLKSKKQSKNITNKVNPEIKKILYLGEYSKPKGPDLLVNALKKVKLPYEANFYGEGMLFEELKKESSGFPISINDKVSYEMIPKIISEHDIIVVPSLVGEGFSRVALEAISAGKIVVASNIGGITDVVNKKTGFLFDKFEELPRKIEEAMKSNIVPHIEDKFARENIVKGVIDIYKKLI
jgi:glycosyltransferase involved in cell wall biosynthesis